MYYSIFDIISWLHIP